MGFEDGAGTARKARQGQREFLRDGLPDIDDIAGQRLEGYILVDGFLALHLGHAVAQREIRSHCAFHRIKRDNAALYKSGFERGPQQNDVAGLPGEFDLGSEPSEREQIETTSQCVTFGGFGLKTS